MIRDLGVGIGVDVDTGPLADLDRILNDVVRRISTFDAGGLNDLEVNGVRDDFRDLDDTIERVESSIDNLDNNNLNNLENEANNAEGAFSKLKTGILAIGAAVAAGFAIDKIKDFGLSAIEAAASGQARDAQFSSVFGDMEAGAAESLGKISQTTGMYENRLKGTFTQIAAFAKTTGADTADALALSERATLAAADSAAFYDRSIEESAESLQSFLKGKEVAPH
ncbi:hypothetical protein [Lysinibacillus capsici]|uniref:hypothetical protein n=1 Tax=Lysinibacillus capsici TaxID=2115968 RepID=UPI0028B22434|nr:hypothetical protein [Lysinibacillus capsici]